MANLDSFFAKKDKKKKGKRFTGTSTTAMAKALETSDVLAAPEPEKKDFQIDLPSGSKSADDEWHEVEEKEQDLEGLKIRSLRNDDIEERAEKNADKTDEESDANDQSAEVMNLSPWQVVVPTPEPAEVEAEPEQEEEEVEPEATPTLPPPPPAATATATATDDAEKKPATPATYVPPNRRNQADGGGGGGGRDTSERSSEPYRPSGRTAGTQYRPPGVSSEGVYRPPNSYRRKTNAPPDIQNEQAFPSLGVAGKQ